MPIVGLGLHVLIAIYFATHVVRTGQDKYWLWILFAFPLLGSVVYALAIWLPDARHSRQGRQVVRGVKQLIDPTRELRAAQEQLDIAATADNHLRLADALMGAGRASEAVVQYQAVLRGVHANDGAITVRYATALLDAGKANEAREVLDRLIGEQPNFKSPEGHLVYARAVAALGDRTRASAEFDVLVGYFAGLEARARYAALLMEWGERHRAAALIEESLKLGGRMPRYAREINKPWLAELQRLRDRPA